MAMDTLTAVNRTITLQANTQANTQARVITKSRVSRPMSNSRSRVVSFIA
jgi:hypothetical protein